MAIKLPTFGPWTKRRQKRTLLVCDEHGNQIAAIRPVKRYGISGDDDANANLIMAAPDLDFAAGLAITALGFEQERAARENDGVALAQITTAKNALIAAQNKARGRERQMLDVTPAPRHSITRES